MAKTLILDRSQWRSDCVRGGSILGKQRHVGALELLYGFVVGLVVLGGG